MSSGLQMPHAPSISTPPSMQPHAPVTPNDAGLPFSQWTQHRAENGMIYLAHPHTRQVKWLWSRHLDPQSGNDYLVNTVTGAREWVTPQNAHYCGKRLPPLDPSVHHKLTTLDALLSAVEKRTITTQGRHSLWELRKLLNAPHTGHPVLADVQQRLVEIGEIVTQEMIKVDAVESEGSDIVRKRRKQVVTRLLEISEEVERLRSRLPRPDA